MVAGDALSHDVGGAFPRASPAPESSRPRRARISAAAIIRSTRRWPAGAARPSTTPICGWRGATRIGIAIAKSPAPITASTGRWSSPPISSGRRTRCAQAAFEPSAALTARVACGFHDGRVAPKRARERERQREDMMIRRLTLAAAAAVAFSSAAFAADVVGEWKRDDGKAKVRFAPCGGGASAGRSPGCATPTARPRSGSRCSST